MIYYENPHASQHPSGHILDKSVLLKQQVYFAIGMHAHNACACMLGG